MKKIINMQLPISNRQPAFLILLIACCLLPILFTACKNKKIIAVENRQKKKLWTCPMHPEIIRDKPGTCPICGMALEPMVPTIDGGENPELIDMRRRFWACLV